MYITGFKKQQINKQTLETIIYPKYYAGGTRSKNNQTFKRD